MWGTQGSSSGCQTCYQVPLSTESFCVPLLNFLAKALHSLKVMWTGESGFLQLEGNLLCSLGSCTVSFAASICGALSQDRGMQQQTAQNLAKQKALDSTMNRTGQFPGN